MLWLLARALFRRLDNARDFGCISLPELRIDARLALRVSIDGEVTELNPPPRYRVRRGGLRIIRPSATGQVWASEN